VNFKYLRESDKVPILFITNQGFCDNRIPFKVSQDPKAEPERQAGPAEEYEFDLENRQRRN
jgi:hypothetical protein